MEMARSPLERAGLWFCMAILLAFAASAWLEMREVRLNMIGGDAMGQQTVTTVLPDSQAVETTRLPGERLEDWIARHVAAVEAVEGN